MADTPISALPSGQVIGMIASGSIRAGSNAGNNLTIQARDVDGASWTSVITVTSNNTPTLDLLAGATIGGVAIVSLTGTQTLTNKTLTSPTINGGTWTGGTDLAVADGGTGASTAAAARANLGANLYHFEFQQIGNWNPLDATTYYGGNFLIFTTAGITASYSPQAGTVVKARLLFWVGAILGSNEAGSLYLRLNNTTDYLLSSNVVLNARVYNELVTGLSIPLLTTDAMELKFVAPTYATNPTAVNYKVILEIER